RQSAAQPSPSVAFPSSQTSPRLTFTVPSPQRAAFTQAEPGTGQPQPLSSAHVLLQTSPAFVLPSSHVSPGSTRLFPQTVVWTHFTPGVQVKPSAWTVQF